MRLVHRIIVFFVICVLFVANSHVIPTKNELSESLTRNKHLVGSPERERVNEFLPHKLHSEMGSTQGLEAKRRKRRWAVPADIQDIPCDEGFVRRHGDGLCRFVGSKPENLKHGEDDYDS